MSNCLVSILRLLRTLRTLSVSLPSSKAVFCVTAQLEEAAGRSLPTVKRRGRAVSKDSHGRGSAGPRKCRRRRERRRGWVRLKQRQLREGKAAFGEEG